MEVEQQRREPRAAREHKLKNRKEEKGEVAVKLWEEIGWYSLEQETAGCRELPSKHQYRSYFGSMQRNGVYK